MYANTLKEKGFNLPKLGHVTYFKEPVAILQENTACG